MTRSDGDSWDIATSVGSTAVLVAAARAAETASEQPLIRDEFAELLISTPELSELMSKMSSTFASDAEFENIYRHMVDYQAARTHFFDAFFAAAADAGIRQHVILAAGLDSRAYRLGWPAGTVVYEVDLPKVLEYKSSTLAAHGGQPTATRREVPADLRYDWPKSLRDSGFDPAQPTAWLAEGLLLFLPGEAQDRMFDDVTALSAAGSRVALEVWAIDDAARDAMDRQRQRAEELRARLGQDNVFDPGDLWYDDDDRSDPAEWFAAHGWHTESVTGGDYLARLGRPLPDQVEKQPPVVGNFVTAQKS
ncbi:class I SAM-dependent methyltransferase [Mycobacterium sp.]|jgi:methyltransferase (TIGR00027 family)|uniref:class I SAM-dependent methyltransferase n=1 Tax=Mycobacterium sp. TaxID=1785 RepID=UPI002D26717B|nr:class I SAM-dependent methyltransferase [Mycobacterium sp.]HZA12659.1 class I SAM-dependent methyltransferase [Mycobacterium sp.]